MLDNYIATCATTSRSIRSQRLKNERSPRLKSQGSGAVPAGPGAGPGGPRLKNQGSGAGSGGPRLTNQGPGAGPGGPRLKNGGPGAGPGIPGAGPPGPRFKNQGPGAGPVPYGQDGCHDTGFPAPGVDPAPPPARQAGRGDVASPGQVVLP